MSARMRAPTPTEAFRVPNSVLQSLTTSTDTAANRLPAFTMTTLLGLMALVDPKRPANDVRTKIATILDIIEVGRGVAHAVEQEWTTQSGETHVKRYAARRFSPSSVQHINAALLQLHSQTVVVQRRNPRQDVKRENCVVHLLDMFGYCYGRGSGLLDLDDLPPNKKKVNVGSEDRPVWRLRRVEDGQDVDERPVGVVFRLNKELAEELSGSGKTIGFTLIARRVFGLLRTLHHNSAAIRLLLLTLRQRNDCFFRRLGKLLEALGCDTQHPERAMETLTTALDNLRSLGVITGYAIDASTDRIEISKDPTWLEKTALVRHEEVSDCPITPAATKQCSAFFTT